jgi:hypothetical protein
MLRTAQALERIKACQQGFSGGTFGKRWGREEAKTESCMRRLKIQNA